LAVTKVVGSARRLRRWRFLHWFHHREAGHSCEKRFLEATKNKKAATRSSPKSWASTNLTAV
jgi:hypothetical protein